MTLLLLLALGRATVPFDWLPPERRPTLDGIERALSVRAVNFGAFNLRGGYDSYLTRWHPRVAVVVHWRFDERRVVRVERVSFRLRTDRENFLPLRHNP